LNAAAYPLTAILSDLHGNRQALDVALGDAAARGAERLVCLGDVVGYGARPAECLERVIELTRGGVTPAAAGKRWSPGLCLLGNHEHALLDSAIDFNPRARAAIEWTRGEVQAHPRSAELWNFLGGLSASGLDARAHFAHGSPRDPLREYVLPTDLNHPTRLSAWFDAMQRPVCFVGHSHVPAVYYEDRRFFRPRGTEGPYRLGASERLKVLINVGSVGQPRDGDPRLSYVLFDGSNVTFVRLDYDIAGAQADIRAVPALPDTLAQRLEAGR
jgi:diadenosine tetraphosphatase ApaH/serine/threonine PP2A family protein phosphatase